MDTTLNELPKKWKLRVHGHEEDIANWLNINKQTRSYYTAPIRETWVYYPSYSSAHLYDKDIIGYEEVTWEQFENFYLKPKVEKYTLDYIKNNKVAIKINSEEELKKIVNFVQKEGLSSLSIHSYQEGHYFESAPGNSYRNTFYCDKERLDSNDLIIDFSQIQFETMDKKIIGYKLREEFKQFERAVKAIGGDWWDRNAENNFKREGFHFAVPMIKGNGIKGEMEKAGVLDLWFEPVFEEQYKIGDWVIASIDDTKYIGRYNGPDEDNFKLKDWSHTQSVYVPHNGGSFRKIERLATLKEIEAVTKIEIEGYEMEVLSVHAKFGCKSFSRTEIEGFKKLLAITEKKVSIKVGNTEITKELIDKILKKVS